MKRFISLFIVAALSVSMLSGCKREVIIEDNASTEAPQETESSAGANEAEAVEFKPEEGAELMYWTTSGDLEFGKAIAQAFEAKYGIPVSVQENGLDTVNKMMLDGPSGNGADVYMAAHDNFSTIKDAGIVLELDKAISENIKVSVKKSALDTVTVDDKIYGVPVSVEGYALLYNKDLVQGEPASTMEQIWEEAKNFNNPSENKFWYLTLPTDGFPAYTFLSAHGFRLFGIDGMDNDNPGFNTEEFKKGLEEIAKLKEIIPIQAEDLKMSTLSLLEENFKNGKTAYYPMGPWVIKSLEEEKVNYGVTALPTYGGVPLKSFGSVQNAHVSPYSKFPKAAQLFAEFLVSEEGASILYKSAYKITSRIDTSTVEGLKDDNVLSVYAKQFEAAEPMPGVKRMSYYWTIMQSVLPAVFEGEITPEEGAAKAQKDFEALVASE